MVGTRLLSIVVGMVLLCSLPTAADGISDLRERGPTSSAGSPLNVTFTYMAFGSCDGGPASVPFNSSVSGGTAPYNYTWNFGDSSPTGYGAKPTHTYADSFGGPYNVTLTVNDSKRATASATESMQFVFPPCPGSTPPILTPLDIIAIGVGAAAVVAVGVALLLRRRPKG